MNRCISREDYLIKDNSNVGYALYVQDNIKKDDYARLNTGQIVRIIGIRENELDKKAIYFNIYNEDWCDSTAVENFSENIIDLIEVEDIVHTRDVLNEDIVYIWSEEYLKALKEDLNNGIELVDILTFEQYTKNCYTVERKE